MAKQHILQFLTFLHKVGIEKLLPKSKKIRNRFIATNCRIILGSLAKRHESQLYQF